MTYRTKELCASFPKPRSLPQHMQANFLFACLYALSRRKKGK